MITSFKNGLVNVQDNWMSWISVCYILMWPLNSELTQSSVDLANKQLSQVQAQRKLLEIEIKVSAIIENYKIGLDFNLVKWHTLLKPKILATKNFMERYGIDQSMSLSEVSRCFVDANNLSEQLPFITDEFMRNQRNPLVSQLYQFRKDMKFINNYWFNVRKIGEPIGSGVYTLRGTWVGYSSYTGRMNCTKLPMMALPKLMRLCLNPPEGYEYLSMDFSSIEFRIAAAITHCYAAQRIFDKGMDIHSYTGKSLVNYTKFENKIIHQLGKKVTFAILYGGSSKAISSIFQNTFAIEMDKVAADKVIGKFYSAYPELLALRNVNRNRIITPNGRIPLLIDMKNTQLINLPIQLIGSILLKRALISISNISTPIMSVHDEIIFKVSTDTDLEEFESQIIKVIGSDFITFMPELNLTNIFQFKKYTNNRGNNDDQL